MYQRRGQWRKKGWNKKPVIDGYIASYSDRNEAALHRGRNQPSGENQDQRDDRGQARDREGGAAQMNSTLDTT
jgi:hypothetical protein